MGVVKKSYHPKAFPGLVLKIEPLRGLPLSRVPRSVCDPGSLHYDALVVNCAGYVRKGNEKPKRQRWPKAHQALRVWRLALRVWRFAFGVWRLAFGVWRLAFGVRRSAFGVRRSAFGVRRSCSCSNVVACRKGVSTQ